MNVTKKVRVVVQVLFIDAAMSITVGFVPSCPREARAVLGWDQDVPYRIRG